MKNTVNSRQLEYLTKEFCILVNKKDQAIGKASKLDCHLVANNLPLHRAFSVFIYHGNQLLLQQRSHVKVTWPLKWTNSCCSHPLMFDDKEELLEDAILRKTRHELGIVAVNLKFIGKIIYKAEQLKWGEHELDHIYTAECHSKDVPYNTEEVEAIRWVNQNDASLLNQVHLTPWFNLIKSKVDIFKMDPWDSVLDLRKD